MTFDDKWFGREKLHFAAADGDVVRIAELIAAGHDPNVFDELGMTPLHHAAKAESLRAVQQLLAVSLITMVEGAAPVF